MKTPLCILVSSIVVFAASLGMAQTPASGSSPSSKENSARRVTPSGQVSGGDDSPHFDLAFPGGTPAELIAAIEKAQGAPVNVVVPTEHSDVKLPAFNMRGVTVSQLLNALSRASTTTDSDPASPTYLCQKSYSFNSADRGVWFFTVDRSGGFNQLQVRAYLLTPYLEKGLTVDDVTTALQTTWQMSGAKKELELRYHKETKLLIVAGGVMVHQMVEQVLQALRPVAAQQSSAEKKAAK